MVPITASTTSIAIVARIGRGRRKRRQPPPPRGGRGTPEPGRPVDRGGGWSGQAPGGAAAEPYCRTWYWPRELLGGHVSAPLDWLAGMLTVGSPPLSGGGPSRNQPSGHSLMVGPPIAVARLHRLYLQDGLAAKSAVRRYAEIAASCRQ